MSHRIRRLAGFILVAVVLAAPVARAQAQEDAKARARAESQRGEGLYSAGKYAEAIAAFEAAQAIFPHPNNLFNLAKSYEKMAEYDKAMHTWETYLDLYEMQNHSPAPDKEDVARTIVFLKEKAFQALPEVTIDSDPTGADVYVDSPDKLLGQTPLVTHLPEGTHKVFMKRQGCQGFEREFAVRSREPLRLTFALEKTRNEGALRFTVNIRHARISVDGKVVAVTPFTTELPVEAGRHQVTIEKERYNQVSQVVEVEIGQTRDIEAKLHLLSTPFSWRGYIGVTSMVLGAGAVLTAALYARPQGNKYWAVEPNYKLFKTVAYTGYGVGAALLAGGTGLLVWELTRHAVDTDDRAALPVMIGLDPRGGAWIGASRTF